MNGREIGLRWTIGDVSEQGFEALRLSVAGAQRIFGPAARYAVCVNSVPLSDVQRHLGPLATSVEWIDASERIPSFLQRWLDVGMAEGVAWKLAPLRVFPNAWEIALDNDCILWEAPTVMLEWLARGDPGSALIAADVKACFGRFAPLCGPEPRNTGIRGLAPGFDLQRALEAVLAEIDETLASELDEQGMQVAALLRTTDLMTVPVEDVTICSPFEPHLPYLGRCGAHFVGLNARRLPWSWEGRSGDHYVRENWARHRGEVAQRVGVRLEPVVPRFEV